ncbi:MAG TPA: isocitrate lyase/phosphoenolpyruvate mutase family protein [Acidimicrobiales bacterium]|nr:isocitrate lyase/phosphoenolpyruvate mutase family protein [Acidimicrobiales bacterium]
MLMGDAAAFRAMHVPGSPVVLPNAWDAWSARMVARAGFPAVASSSAAVARSLGSEDGEVMSVDLALDAARRMCVAVPDVPVTIDFEGGYGLPGSEIAARLLDVGAAGCNLEDTDRRTKGELLPLDDVVARIAAVRAAAGDRLVINARVDSFIRGRPDARRESIERGRAYLDAGADCVYPITASDEGDLAAMVEALGVVNVYLSPATPSLSRLAELGVARVSVGGGLFEVMTSQVGAVLTRLHDDGDDSVFREG